MLTSNLPSADERTAAPEPAPLVTGSPAAVALHDLWVGHHSAELVAAEPDDRLVAAATVASHLARRAGLKVLVAVDHPDDRGPVIAKVSEQIDPSMIAASAIGLGGMTYCLPSGWLPAELRGDRGVIVSARGYDADVHADIRVRLGPYGCGPAELLLERTVWVTGRRSATAVVTTGIQADYLRLGEVPLDVAFAGTQEGP